MTSRRAIRAFVVAVAAAAVGGAAAAGPAPALTVTDTLERDVTFASDVCDPVTRTVTLPRGARSVRVTQPDVGELVDGEDGTPVAAITDVTVTRRSGRARVQVTAEPDPAACVDPATGTDHGWTDDGFGVPVTARYRRTVRVWVQGTGRGDNPAVRPRVLPFGMRSAVVGIRWSRWGGRTAVGRGQVEFNNCQPDCARARPQYFPVRVVLERPRDCGSRWKYTRLRFRYTTSARPPGLGATYREFLGC
jgi:hypothetical protein